VFVLFFILSMYEAASLPFRPCLANIFGTQFVALQRHSYITELPYVQSGGARLREVVLR
jgi:hypothetical protein